MKPAQHATACTIAAQVLDFYDAIPRETRQAVLLDWFTEGRKHWRVRPGECVHCHSPAPTNLIDDEGRYSHKTCAEICLFLAGPPVANDHERSTP